MSELTSSSMSPVAPGASWATVTLEHHVATVTLKATGKGSRQGPAFWLESPALFGWLDAHPDVRAVVLRGEGEAFSHGLDLVAMGEDLAGISAPGAGAAERATLHELVLRMQRATTAIAACRKPVIAAVHGWCIGAGLDLISACDVRLCSAEAKFSVREVKMAIVADMGSLARLPAIIGQGATRELALTGDDVDAVRARELRLVSKVLATPAELFAEAQAMAARIAANPPRVVEGIKQVLNHVSERDARASLEYVAVWNAAFMPSNDLLEAMGSFLERRPPAFTGT
jgi:enoyl-CoA hydratase